MLRRLETIECLTSYRRNVDKAQYHKRMNLVAIPRAENPRWKVHQMLSQKAIHQNREKRSTNRTRFPILASRKVEIGAENLSKESFSSETLLKDLISILNEASSTNAKVSVPFSFIDKIVSD